VIAVFGGRSLVMNDERFAAFYSRSALWSLCLSAGLLGVALSGFLIAWLGFDEQAGMYAKLGSFLVVLISIGWSYDKLRERQ